MTRPAVIANEDRVVRDIREETLGRWNETVLGVRKFLMANVTGDE